MEGLNTGYKVHLVEQGESLGGYAARIHKLLPALNDQTRLREPDAQIIVDRVMAHPKAEIYLRSSVKSIAGEPGSFTVVLDNDRKTTLKTGAVVVSTGWKPYEPGKLAHLGYGLSPGVKTMEEFERFVVGDACLTV